MTLLSGLSRTALVIIAIIAVVLIAGFALLYWMFNSNSATMTTKEHIELSPTQIESIEAIGQWEFLSISDEELVDTVRHGFFGDDELVRIYSGTLRLGIDLADAEEGWIRTDGDTRRPQSTCQQGPPQDGCTLSDTCQHRICREECHRPVPPDAARHGLPQCLHPLQRAQ